MARRTLARLPRACMASATPASECKAQVRATMVYRARPEAGLPLPGYAAFLQVPVAMGCGVRQTTAPAPGACMAIATMAGACMARAIAIGASKVGAAAAYGVRRVPRTAPAYPVAPPEG